MTIRVLVVDDEPLACERMASLLEEEADVEVLGACRDGSIAVAEIRSKAPDLIFLDIQLPEMDGFDIVRALGEDKVPAIIFVTAYDHFAVNAFRVHAVDYLLKPVDSECLAQSLRYYRTRREVALLPDQLNALLQDLRVRSATHRILLKSSEGMLCLSPKEIDWVESAGNYVCFHVGTQTHISRETLAETESRLRAHNFVRIHRSAIVNSDRIRKLKPMSCGDYRVELRDGTELPMSRSYREQVLKKISGL